MLYPLSYGALPTKGHTSLVRCGGQGQPASQMDRDVLSTSWATQAGLATLGHQHLTAKHLRWEWG